MNTVLKNYRFPLILLLSIITGAVIGILAKEKAEILKPIGDIFLNLMFTIVVPLVFFTISSSIANMSGAKRLGKIMGSMICVFLFTGLLAAIYMFFILKLVPVAKGVHLELVKPAASESVSLVDQIVKTFTVSDFGQLL